MMLVLFATLLVVACGMETNNRVRTLSLNVMRQRGAVTAGPTRPKVVANILPTERRRRQPLTAALLQPNLTTRKPGGPAKARFVGKARVPAAKKQMEKQRRLEDFFGSSAGQAMAEQAFVTPAAGAAEEDTSSDD
jgi:hypothetical protein